MSPRHYNLGLRQETADSTHAKIISAARELLAAEYGTTEFTIDAVAKKADVARMTVYNRFKSKTGLIEAVFDDIAAHGQMTQMPTVFAQSTSLATLDRLIGIFGEFWSSDRLVIRRIRALGALDHDIGQALSSRDQNRLQLVEAVLTKVALEHGRPAPDSFHESTNMVYAFTGFEFFDALAGAEQSPQAVVPTVQRLVRGALGLPK
jgi:AcrR family transcriptional regulator